MTRPIYLPPYDSPLEDAFAYHAVKYLSEVACFRPQWDIQTICGRFVVDFVIESQGGHRVGFECDGKEFHDKARDEWRDAMILGSDALDAIYRLRGPDITYHMNDVLFIVSLCEPLLFSERGHLNLRSLASDDAQQINVDPVETRINITIFDEQEKQLNHIFVERRHKVIPSGHRQFWQSAFAFASEYGGGPLDEVIAAYRNRI
ncbi:MAG: hypothetical protein M0Z85_06445 [Gammaproteobacteria bacterium]|jgi:very-short-patch-repair endonuclease|nr:hypothetical protein [Gammaproteobacteria bacterium]